MDRPKFVLLRFKREEWNRLHRHAAQQRKPITRMIKDRLQPWIRRLRD